MSDVLSGYRVVEVSQFAYVPAAGAVLADWGAGVVKIVHPVYGDVMYTALAYGLPPTEDGTAFMWEIVNRNKRSIGIDLASEGGRRVLDELIEGADVFVTNFLAPARRKLRIDLDDVRAVNPRIVYARGSGQGVRGPEADDGGYDSVSFWARSGWANPLVESAGKFMYQPGPGCGDVTAGFALAGGVVAALLKRERTGKTSVVDGSLLASGAWGMSGAIAASSVYGMESIPLKEKRQPGNALTHGYQTKDRRWILLGGILHNQGFQKFAEKMEHPEWAADPRFSTHDARVAHNDEFVTALDEAFSQATLAEWRDRLAGMPVPFGVVQNTAEVGTDGQVVANGYVQEVELPAGRTIRLTGSPVQFDGQPVEMRPAPVPGQQTEEVLLELGHSWGEITSLKAAGAVI